jgi:hypothetical protein
MQPLWPSPLPTTTAMQQQYQHHQQQDGPPPLSATDVLDVCAAALAGDAKRAAAAGVTARALAALALVETSGDPLAARRCAGHAYGLFAVSRELWRGLRKSICFTHCLKML